MTIENFVNKWKGKQLEVAGSQNAKFQCVDLVNGYIRDVLELGIVEWTNAKDFPERFNKNDFEYIENTPNGVPLRGDIMVWNGNVGGGYGHISLFLSGNIGSFQSFDQNWSIPLFCTIENHSYNNVRGWLRPKNNWLKKEEIVEIVYELESEVVEGILKGLCTETSKNEVDAYLAKGINVQEIVEDVCNGNARFYDRWIAPKMQFMANSHEKNVSSLKAFQSIEIKRMAVVHALEIQTLENDKDEMRENYIDLREIADNKLIDCKVKKL